MLGDGRDQARKQPLEHPFPQILGHALFPAPGFRQGDGEKGAVFGIAGLGNETGGAKQQVKHGEAMRGVLVGGAELIYGQPFHTGE